MAKLLPGNSKYKKCCRWGLKFKLIPVVRLSLLLYFSFVFYLNPLHGQITSVNNGDWNSTFTWDGAVPTVSDYVTVDNVIGNKTITVTVQSGTIAEVNDLHIGQNGKLVIEGTLVVYGNLTMANNDPELIAGSDATIIIHGDAIISNKVNINLSSFFIVLGNFIIDGGGATDINIDDASIYVFGSFDRGSTGLNICDDYDNITENYNPDSCHVGTETAFDENDASGLIPEEIIELVDPCQVSATISGDIEVCHGDLVAYLHFSSATGDEYSIDFDATAESQGFVDVSGATLPDSAIELNVPENAQPDSYSAEFTITNSTTGCTSRVYNITIIINPLPATGEIIPD